MPLEFDKPAECEERAWNDVEDLVEEVFGRPEVVVDDVNCVGRGGADGVPDKVADEVLVGDSVDGPGGVVGGVGGVPCPPFLW